MRWGGGGWGNDKVYDEVALGAGEAESWVRWRDADEEKLSLQDHLPSHDDT